MSQSRPLQPLVPLHGQRSPTVPREKKRVAVLGSTGSIGRSTLDLIRSNPNEFEVVVLAAGANHKLMSSQVAEFKPKYALMADEAAYRLLLAEGGNSSTEILQGELALSEIVQIPEIDIVVAGIVGFAGFRSTLSALEANKVVALANKESLVSGGKFVAQAIEAGKGTIIPVDSEHSALYQALNGEQYSQIESLIVTASGGPFLHSSYEELLRVTPEQAVKHPRWSMGAKISIDSATLMNKALEVIEAHWLFGLPGNQIQVVVHPQSIIHSLVEFIDGTQMAQLSVPDMKGAIGYALAYPHGRLSSVMERLDLSQIGSLDFFKPDTSRFPALSLAFDAIDAGGAAGAVFNAANEEAVELFVNKRLAFLDITYRVAEALEYFLPVEVDSVTQLEELVSVVRAFVHESKSCGLERGKLYFVGS